MGPPLRAALTALVLATVVAPAAADHVPPAAGRAAPAARRALATPGLRYQPTADGAGFTAWSRGRAVEVRASGFTVDGGASWHLVGARPAAARPGDRLPGVSHETIGTDPARWRTAIPSYASVRFPDVYPGVDVIFRGAGPDVRYDFVVAPGADPAAIAFQLEGPDPATLAGDGALVAGPVRHAPPLLYQIAAGIPRPIVGGFTPRAGGAFGFRVGPHDSRRPLVIDPTVAWLTFVGGAGDDAANAIAADPAGNLYVCGQRQVAAASPANAYVWKLAPDGTLVWEHTIGGTGVDLVRACVADATGVYAVGLTASTNFPTTPSTYQFACPKGPTQTTCVGNRGFAFKLDATSAARVFATYVGGATSDEAWSVALDDSGDLIIAGDTRSPDFLTNPAPGKIQHVGVQAACAGTTCADAFVLRLHPGGQDAEFATFLGGTGVDLARAVTTDVDGVIVAGSTTSPDFPTTLGALRAARHGPEDAFVTRLEAQGQLVFMSTYLGGDGTDAALAAATIATGVVAIAGRTTSVDFPGPASSPCSGNCAWNDPVPALGGQDAFAITLDLAHPYVGAIDTPPTDTPIRWSSLLGGAGDDQASAVAATAAGTVHVAGQTTSTEVHDAPQGSPGGALDAFAAAIRPVGTTAWFTYLGGSGADRATGIALTRDDQGSTVVNVVGVSQSLDLATPLGLEPSQVITPHHGGSPGDGFAITLGGGPTPVVILPGILGSRLLDDFGDGVELWPDLHPLRNVRRLSRFPDELDPSLVATDVIRQIDVPIYGRIDVYGPLIAYLVALGGYVEYDLVDAATGRIDVQRRTTDGCDVTQTEATLFVFAYDWRRDIGDIALALREYLGCIQRLHPGTQIDLVAHSMGGLVARRFVLDNPGDVRTVVTIGSPFLGAPKMTYVLETGDVGVSPARFDIFGPIRRWLMPEYDTRHITGSFTSAHQLMPGPRAYEVCARRPLVEGDWDFNGNGLLGEQYPYDAAMSALDAAHRARFPMPFAPLPGTANRAFHTQAQDDWSSPALPANTDVRYGHIIGVQSAEQTVEQIKTVIDLQLPGPNQNRSENYDVTFGRGDGTVPYESARRRARRGDHVVDYNAPHARYLVLDGNVHGDDAVEHSGMLTFAPVQQQVLAWLRGDGWSSRTAPAALIDEGERPAAPQYRIDVMGGRQLAVRDAAGNQTPDPANPLARLPGVLVMTTGARHTTVLTPLADHTIELTTTGGALTIAVVAQRDEGDRLQARWLDVVVADGTRARLVVDGTLATLRLDLAGDGSFATVLPPTHTPSGVDAADLAPPRLRHRARAVAGGIEVTVIAEDDGAGVAAVWTCLGDAPCQPYADPLVIDPAAHPTLDAFADDRAGNRSSLARFAVEEYDPPAVEPPPDAGPGPDPDPDPRPDPTAGGCGCHTGGGTDATLAGLLALALCVRRRRIR